MGTGHNIGSFMERVGREGERVNRFGLVRLSLGRIS